MLVPLDLRSLIPDDHICFYILDIVDQLDFTDLENKYRFNAGKPAYSRHMLMRIVLMASVDGVFSSRKIMKLTNENYVYTYLSGRDSPDFRTILRFKIEAKELIEKAFQATVLTAKKSGILNLEHISIDGTKIKANASNNNNLTEKEIQTIKKIIQKGIDVDKEEDELYGEDNDNDIKMPLNKEERKKLIKEIFKEIEDNEKEKYKNNKPLKRSAKNLIKQAFKNPKKILEKLEQAEKQLIKSGQKSVSMTDPESRWMQNKKKKIEFSYNLQISADHKSGIILSNSVTQDPTDHHQLIPQIEKIQNLLGPLNEDTALSADNGYFTLKNLTYIQNNKINAYIPSRKQATEEKTNNKNKKPYSKHNFTYNHEKNYYICPQKEKLPYKKTYEYKGKKRDQYYTNKCLKCSEQLKCAGKNRVKIITCYGGELPRKMELKMETPEAQKEYAKRKETVEWPYGNIKQNLKFTEYYTRGQKQTTTESNLICIAHNIKRLYNELNNKIQPKTNTKPTI
jgi:transposase